MQCWSHTDADKGHRGQNLRTSNFRACREIAFRTQAKRETLHNCQLRYSHTLSHACFLQGKIAGFDSQNFDAVDQRALWHHRWMLECWNVGITERINCQRVRDEGSYWLTISGVEVTSSRMEGVDWTESCRGKEETGMVKVKSTKLGSWVR